VTEPATILFGSELITREDATQRLLTRLLGRLPSALWNTDPDDQTVQRDLAYAIAQQEALWLENRTTARNMTLLLEATGLDLDTCSKTTDSAASSTVLMISLARSGCTACGYPKGPPIA
jgi:hypothetical protein